MTCREFTDFLIDYVDGDLAAAERAVFDEHLGSA
jgi:anti-sigma factor RsiW